MPEEEVKHISELKFDPKNARRRTERSSYMIRTSLEKFGGMRSIVVDDQNIVRAGSGTLEEAGQIGIEKVRIVEADGNELIAVRRKGLTEEEWKEYAIADNRSSDLSEWEGDILNGLSQEIDLSWMFQGDELKGLIEENSDNNNSSDRGKRNKEPREVYCVCPECQYRFIQQVD